MRPQLGAQRVGIRESRRWKDGVQMAKQATQSRVGDAKADGKADVKRRFATGVDLPDATRRTMIELLNQELADTADLASQSKQAHWNVKGAHFYPLHLLFDELAAKRQGEADQLAERATALGGYATGTVRMAAATSQLAEISTEIDAGMAYVEALVQRYAAHANQVRAAIEAADRAGDMDTADLLTEISRELDKDLWFLRAHLQD
jgi:starvation-inducible DNA-binding protein